MLSGEEFPELHCTENQVHCCKYRFLTLHFTEGNNRKRTKITKHWNYLHESCLFFLEMYNKTIMEFGDMRNYQGLGKCNHIPRP